MTTDPAAIGLCHRCVHARRVPTRHAIYWRCALAESDPRFPRYPRLPVLACAGYARADEAPPAPGDAAPPAGGGPEDPPAGGV